MAVTARKYNPGFLTDDELVVSFCVRSSEFESIIEMLRECTGSANPHQIVIGPRGSGKTSLLLRVAAELRRDAGLSSGFFPIVFAEESYEVATAGEFWLECLSRLAVQAPHRESDPDLRRTWEELRTIHDDRTLAERCLVALLDFSDREGKRLVLMVENLNMMFRDMADPDAGWRLRKILQTEPRIVLIASATSRFAEIDNPDHALYDLFRVVTLRPLDTSECAVLWETVSGRCPQPETIRSLEILTGGSPRLIAIVARFGADRSFRELMADLLDLVDDHTEYFKSHIESLPAQERRVYLALAELWKPATTREVADRSRLETSKCSAQLARLIDRGVVQVAGGSARRKQCYLSERLYNIYYLMRRSRGPDSLIEALVKFMESYYSPRELRDIGARIAHEAERLGAEMRELHRTALARLMALPGLAGYREELAAMIPENIAGLSGRNSAPLDVESTESIHVEPDHRLIGRPEEHTDEQTQLTRAKALAEKAAVLVEQNRKRDALAVYDEIIHRFGESDAPAVFPLVLLAFANKNVILLELNRTEDALAACGEVIHRFETNDAPVVVDMVATALLTKGTLLAKLKQPVHALAAFEEVVNQFGESETSSRGELAASALVNKGVILGELNQTQDALTAYDEVVRQFGESEIPAILEQVATALVNKGNRFVGLNRKEEALSAYEDVALRFGESETPALCRMVAFALVNKGEVHRGLNRSKEALIAYEDVIRRFGESKEPALLEPVAKAIVSKGLQLGELQRPQEALVCFDEALCRFGQDDAPALRERLALALVGRGLAYSDLNQAQEALAAYEQVIHQFGEYESFPVRAWVEFAVVKKADLELEHRRYEAAINTVGGVLEQGRTELKELQCQGYEIRAKAALAIGELSISERDIQSILDILPEFDSFPRNGINALMELSIDLGPARMRDLILASSSANFLLPLTTALELEIGLEPRVAREVEEVAQDIWQGLTKLREMRTDAGRVVNATDMVGVQPDRKNL